MQSCKIRPHHGLCTQFFIGKGYDSLFISNMQHNINKLAKTNPVVKLVIETDIFCEKCPNNAGGICKSFKPSEYDKRVLEILGINENTEMKWSSFQIIAKDKIIKSGRLNEVCGDCQWYEICMKKPS